MLEVGWKGLPVKDDRIEAYLSGEKLYGDDFDEQQILEWFRGEQEGYANLGAKDRSRYSYPYHALNNHQFFHLLEHRTIDEALGLGSAYGDEFVPVAGKIGRITVVDPSDAFASRTEIHGTPCTYVKPAPSGDMPFRDNQFGLITCFGVMHHIPNVSHVLGECHRCLAEDGLMMLREPIVSMGDWRKPRRGLTKNERGIPAAIFDEMVAAAGFKVKHRTFSNFRPLVLISGKLGKRPFNAPAAVVLDSWISNGLPWRLKYHRTTFFDKLSPATISYVLEK
jgi:ubiquinone/menaquinone biosynthesis C-methylase UbiE